MSAIGGILRPKGARVERFALERMEARLRPCGRDARQLECRGEAGFVRTLLHVTPEDRFDRQPLSSGEASLTLLFDGRIDNREELANQLGLHPGDMKEMADSFLVLRAFEHWGEGAVTHLLGDFALALWQPRNHTLLLARDPLGQRPLYWHQQPGLFIFATRCNALFVLPEVPRTICENRLANHLALLPPDGAESFYRDIYRVEPGHWVRFRDGKVRCHTYHRFDPESRVRLPSDDEYLDAFREQVERAVRVRLRAIGGVGSQLSGGFDSSTVTSVAARLLGERGRRLSAYTAVPREGYDGPVLKHRIADEGPAAAALAAGFENIDHLLVRVADRSPLSGLAERVENLGQPPRNTLNLIWVDAISKLAEARGERVLLTAQKGNQSISYHGRSLLYLLLRRGEWTAWYREAAAHRRRFSDIRWSRLLKESLAPFVSQRIWRLISGLSMKSLPKLQDYSLIDPCFARRSGVSARVEAMGRECGSRPCADGPRRRVEMFYRHDLGDHYAAANSLANIEMRDPTADTRLVEFCLAVPEGQYLREGADRWLLRRMMAESFPPEVMNERRKGLQSADWHEGAEAALPEIKIFMETLRSSGGVADYLDLDRMERLVAHWPENGWAEPGCTALYLALFRGMAAGVFIRDILETKPGKSNEPLT